METRKYIILVIGNYENVYVVQFVKNLKLVNPNVHIFFWGYTREKIEADRSFIDCYDECCFFDIKHIIKSSVLWHIKAIKELRKSFKTFVTGKHFDFINIQYIKPEYYFLLKHFKKCASHLVLTPWGSDVYWVKGIKHLLVKQIFNTADFITGSDNRFTKDFTKLFKVPPGKIVHCDLGVAPIDYIIEHKNQISTNEAKHQLGIDNSYVITCGYKAMKIHRHMEMIEAIHKVRKQLPSNLILLFPLTYPHNQEYVEEIRQKIKEYDLKAILFDQFLDIPQLFLLRQATDLFIHIQPTDASSGTLSEYILCEKKILNGAWLKYPNIERNGVKPYFLVDNLEDLGEAIVNAYEAKPIKIDKQILKDLEEIQWKVAIKKWDYFFSDNLT